MPNTNMAIIDVFRRPEHSENLNAASYSNNVKNIIEGLVNFVDA